MHRARLPLSLRLLAKAALALVAALPLAGCESAGNAVGGATGVDLSALGRSETFEQLRGVVDEALSGQGLSLSDDLGAQVDDFLRQGVDTLFDTDAVTARLGEAKENTRRFVDQLVREGTIDSEGLIDMSQQSFEQLVASACPLYPFCE